MVTRLFHYVPGAEARLLPEEADAGFCECAWLDLWSGDGDFALWLTVHERERPEAPGDFEVRVWSWTGYFSFVCSDFPALVHCLREIAPMVHTINQAADAADLARHRARHQRPNVFEPNCQHCQDEARLEMLQ